MRSITLSMTSVFAISPRMEQSPVRVSKTKNAITTMSRSQSSKAVEMFIVEYFLMIMAMMSVPPPEAFSKKSRAAAIAGSKIAKQSSREI